MNFQTIDINNEDYPSLLKEIQNPPKQIHLRGMLPGNAIPAVAIVGTRKATAAGIGVAHEIAAGLARQGITIVSGLAMGIDTAAHRGALSIGGRTIAVLGNGINEIYPAQNEKIAEEILKTGGAIISEYPPGEPSFKQNFIHRNRIISGLTVAVVVIEAPAKSGALATAGFAAEQGRSVFVLPGPVTHPNYVGSHALIRDGAILIAKAADILEDLGLLQETGMEEPSTKNENLELQLDGNEGLIFKVIKEIGGPIYIDRIASLAKLEPQVVNQTLTALLLKGLVRETGGRYEINYR